MRFQIFIPYKSAAKDVPPGEALASVGLEAIAQGCDSREVQQGPDNEPGRVFAWLHPTALQMGYHPEKQTWIPGIGAYHVGFWNDSPPTEKELRKPDHGLGEWTPLGNNEKWILTNPHNVDRVPAFGADGKLILKPDPAFNWLTMEIKRRKEMVVWDADGNKPLLVDRHIEDDFELLTKLLQLNYRIIPEVVIHLELFTETSLMKIAFSFIGLVPSNATRYPIETTEDES